MARKRQRKGVKVRSHSYKTKKRLAIKREMLAKRTGKHHRK